MERKSSKNNEEKTLTEQDDIQRHITDNYHSVTVMDSDLPDGVKHL